jgi:hypothetical protein
MRSPSLDKHRNRVSDHPSFYFPVWMKLFILSWLLKKSFPFSLREKVRMRGILKTNAEQP